MSLDIFCLPPSVFFMGLLALLIIMFLCFKGISVPCRYVLFKSLTTEVLQLNSKEMSTRMRMHAIRKVSVLHVKLDKPVVLGWTDKPPPYDFPPGYEEAIFGNRDSRTRVMVIATAVHKAPQNTRR